MKLRADDLLRLTFVADPRIAPDGGSAVATVSSILTGDGADPPRYRTQIHSFDLATGDGMALTTGDGADTHPRFDPNGHRLAFLRSAPNERAQVFVLPLRGGEARAVTAREAGVTGFAWDPHDVQLACISPAEKAVPQENGAPLRVTRSRHQEEGRDLLVDVPDDLLLVSAAPGQNGGSVGEPRVVGSFPHGASQPAFSPDGATLYVLAATSDEEHAEMRSNLIAVPVDGAQRRPLLPRGMHISSFAVGVESGAICFLAPVDGAAASAPMGLWQVSAEGGEPRLLTGEVDAAPSVAADSRYGTYPVTPVPAHDGWVCAVNVAGRSNLELVAPNGTRTPVTTGDRAVTAFDAQEGVAVFTAEVPDRPGELFLRRADGSERRLSGFNDVLVDEAGFRSPSERVALEREGMELGYWRLEPAEPRDDRAIVVQVHGGPAANYGYGFMFEFQLLAARGYTVVYGNPRGGSSFGLPFAAAIQGGYGTVDADDVMAMVDHAVAHHPATNPPVHLTGGSYGGFMTNWLVGRTDRFRSAVTQRSICNFVSFYGTSDIGPWFTEREAGARPWEDFGRLWQQSPLAHVDRIRTPLLVLHAENDRRCPIEQAEQLYAALKRLGRAPTELVRFPGEGHELSRSGRPDRRIARLEAIVDWFERHP